MVIFILFSCQPGPLQEKPSDEWLQKYTTQSSRTDPGEFVALYDGLPRSLDSLCRLVKCQLIHPMEARQMNLPPDKPSQDGEILDVADMLAELMALDSTGLTCQRKISGRLVVACYHHAMLLASILRYQGIPVRLRAGFSRYYEKQAKVRFGHIICEAWDERSGRWTGVDPDREIVGMASRDFDFACQAWHHVTRNNMDPGIYTSSVSDGIKGIVNLMTLDAAFLVKDEKLYWDLPEIVLREMKDLKDLSADEMKVLNDLADCCIAPDSRMEDISDIYTITEDFRPSGTDYESYMEIVMDRK